MASTKEIHTAAKIASKDTSKAATVSQEDFEAWISDERFNRLFQLPADPSLGRPHSLQVSYADYGYRNDTAKGEEHVLLFFGPLMSSPLFAVVRLHCPQPC
jgi:hypothetical protein